MKLNNFCIWFVLCICMVCAVSCDKNEVYYSYHELKNGEWSKFDTLKFDIDSSLVAPNANYKITVELSINNNYSYRNIWLYAQDNISDSTFLNYSQQYTLADEYGKWYGSGFGAIYQISLNYKHAVRFNEKRDYCIKLLHGMRDEPLKNIEKVGIKIEKEE